MIVKESDYYDEKRKFFKKHKNNFETITKGSSAEDYRKIYVFKDGAEWYENMSRVIEEVEIEIYLCKVKTTVDLFKVEIYNSDDGESKYYYNPWDHTK